MCGKLALGKYCYRDGLCSLIILLKAVIAVSESLVALWLFSA